MDIFGNWSPVDWLFLVLLIANVITWAALWWVFRSKKVTLDPGNIGYYELKFQIRLMLSIGSIVIVLFSVIGFNYETFVTKKLKEKESSFIKLDSAATAIDKTLETMRSQVRKDSISVAKIKREFSQLKVDLDNSGIYYVDLDISADSLFEGYPIKYSQISGKNRNIPSSFKEAPFIFVSAATYGAVITVSTVGREEFKLYTNTFDLPTDRIRFTLMIIPRPSHQ